MLDFIFAFSMRQLVAFVCFICLTTGAVAEGLCAKAVGESAEHYVTDENHRSEAFSSFSSFGDMVVVEPAHVAFLALGMGLPVLLLDETGLRVATEPPLDAWNKKLPDFVFQEDGTVWAFTNVRRKAVLYRLASFDNRFWRDPASLLPRLKRFLRNDWRRRHEDRRIENRFIGHGEIFAATGNGLFALNGRDLKKVPVPPDWSVNDSAPIYVQDLGYFSHIDGDIWFRQEIRSDWQMVASIKDLLSFYSQSPFSLFQGQYDPNTGDVRLLLEDRVMVGQVDTESGALVFDYQFAGDIIIHPPTGQVLVWAGKLLTRKWSEWPETFHARRGLWEMTAAAPQPVTGLEAEVRMSGGGVPLSNSVFHAASGQTILSREGGFALFDGRGLHDFPALAPSGGEALFLKNIGGRIFAKSHKSLFEITPDLEVVEIALPEVPQTLFDLYFSAELDGFILSSRGWQAPYFTKDFQEYEKVAGAREPIIGILGDVTFMDGVVMNSKEQVYLLSRCF